MSFRCAVPIAPPPHPTYAIDQVIRGALEEDSGGIGDITSLATIPIEVVAEGQFLAKTDGILAGICIADRVFELVDASLSVVWLKADGDHVEKGTHIGNVQGSVRSILLAERICLNFLQRMSGIASLTAKMMAEVKAAGSATVVLDTRKTVPGLRLLDKWAVRIGGGMNHRIGLYDMMLIKDNHIAASGGPSCFDFSGDSDVTGLEAAVERAHRYLNAQGSTSVAIEVETGTLDEVREIKKIIQSYGSEGHIRRVMLDNMTHWDGPKFNTDRLRQAIDILKDLDVELEASGNVTLETVGTIALTGVTFISCGALTHSVPAMDISLKIQTQLKKTS